MEHEKEKVLDIAIIDYHLSNLFSVKHACDYLGYNSLITDDPGTIESARSVILPGVGAFGAAMDNLRKYDLITPIKDSIASGKPFLGICLGLQLLFEESEEFGCHKGLGEFNGRVVRFANISEDGKPLKVPHMGWNQIFPPQTVQNPWDSTPLARLCPGEYMYFVHSFHVVPENAHEQLAITSYGDRWFCSSVYRGNVLAVQFHPEKSGSVGINIYKQWAGNLLEGGKNQ